MAAYATIAADLGRQLGTIIGSHYGFEYDKRLWDDFDLAMSKKDETGWILYQVPKPNSNSLE